MNPNLLSKYTGLLLLFFPAALITIPHLGSALLLLLVLTSLLGLYMQRNPVSLDKNEKYFLGIVTLNIVLYIFNVWHFDSKISELDNISRFILLLPIFFYVRKIILDPKYIFYGILIGAIASLIIALYDIYVLQIIHRAHGTTSPVAFGGFSITLALMSFIIGLFSKNRSTKALFYTGFIFASCSSILSSARGAWLVLPVSFVILLIANPKKWLLKTRIIITFIFMLFIAFSYFLPIVKHRVDYAVGNIKAYIIYDVSHTSTGARLEVWRAATIAYRESPIFGIGEGNFKSKIQQLVAQGLVDEYLLELSHVHNEFISALLNRGILGLLILLLLLLVPLVYFSRVFAAEQKERNIQFDVQDMDHRKILPALGVSLITTTIILSLTDIYFSQHKNTIFFVSFIYVIYAVIKQQNITSIQQPP